MIRLLFFILLLTSQLSQAQNFLSWQFKDRYFSVSVGTGTATYFGELNYPDRISSRLKQINAGIEARLLSRVGLRLEGNYFTLQGHDNQAPDSSFQRQRNLSFNSKNFQVQLNGIFYLKKYQGEFHKRWRADPYLLSGVGYLYYSPRADLAGETFSLRPLQTEGVTYKKWALTVPMGVGVKFKVNEFANVNFEVAYHLAFTDYLDDVSQTYATEVGSATAELLSDRKNEIGVVNPTFYDQILPGSARGDSSNNDSFLLINLKVELFLPAELFSGKKSSVIKKPSY